MVDPDLVSGVKYAGWFHLSVSCNLPTPLVFFAVLKINSRSTINPESVSPGNAANMFSTLGSAKGKSVLIMSLTCSVLVRRIPRMDEVGGCPEVFLLYSWLYDMQQHYFTRAS